MLRRLLVLIMVVTGVAAVFRWWQRRNPPQTGEFSGEVPDLGSRLASVRAEIDRLRGGSAAREPGDELGVHVVSDLLTKVRFAQDALNDLQSASAERWDELKARADHVVSELERRLGRA